MVLHVQNWPQLEQLERLHSEDTPQCSRKTSMVHQTFVQWDLHILFKNVKSLIRHLGLTIGNARHVQWIPWTLPPTASWLLILLSHIGSQVKIRQSQSYKLKEFAKIWNVLILKQTLHATHLLKLLDKVCKYEMGPTSIVEDTEPISFYGQTDKVKPVYPLSTSSKRGV